MSKNWQESSLKKLGTRNTTAAGLGGNKATGLAELPNFQVWEFSPNRKLDKLPGKPISQGQRYLVVGRNWSVMMQASIIKAVHDVIGERLGYLFTFEEWFDEWAKNFPNHLRESKKGVTTNFPVTEKKGAENDGKKPLYIEWTKKQGGTDSKYRIVEYWPNPENKAESYLLSGCDRDLVEQILRIHQAPSQQTESVEPIRAETPIMSGHPMVTLYFSSGKTRPGGKQPIRSQISFRLMDKVELPEHRYQGESVLTETDIEQLTKRIKQKFVDTPFKLERGDTIYSYTLKPLGYRFWCPLRNKEEAVKLFSAVTSIQSHSVNEKLIAETKKPIRDNTTPERKVKIAGKDVTLSTAYKNETLSFTHAVLKLPVSKQMKTLLIDPRVRY